MNIYIYIYKKICTTIVLQTKKHTHTQITKLALSTTF